MNTITAKEASVILDCSEATVRNWTRHGYLTPIKDSKNRFDHKEVHHLKVRIERGEIQRLRKRANKKNSEFSFVPEEYCDHLPFVNEIEKIRKVLRETHLDIETTLFTLALKQLTLLGEVDITDPSDFFSAKEDTHWKRSHVKSLMIEWSKTLNVEKALLNDGYVTVYNLLQDVTHDDTLGIIYQSLLLEGNKSINGAYYTPKKVVKTIFEDTPLEKGDRFLDPCCGTGQFLIQAALAGVFDPEQIYGYDIDGLAVKIAKINLLMKFQDKDFSPNIFHADTLKEIATGTMFCKTNCHQDAFDLIATNPPWGSSFDAKSSSIYRHLFPHITSGESFSYFLSKCISLAKKNGLISLILPESILNIRTHADIRKHILEKTSIKGIYHLNRIFKGVFTPVIRLDMIKRRTPENWSVNIVNKAQRTDEIPQKRFHNNNHHIFDINLSNEAFEIISLLYKMPHKTLKNNAEWALGIVTGDNKRFLSNKSLDGMEPIYKGRDIKPYQLSTPSAYIKFEPERFQQVAPEYKYRADEKLIYRFISDQLVFAYDISGSLTLNSANILIPKIENYPIKVILGLLNSKMYQFIYSKKFNTRKVLRGDLESLPFPIIPKSEQTKIIAWVDQAINGNDVQDALELFIMELVGLSPEQMDIIRDYDKGDH